MENDTVSPISPEDSLALSEAGQALFGYTDVRESFIVYYEIEVAIYVITIVTNAMTVTLISCHRRLRILSNLFFACLAVSDLLQGVFGTVFDILRIHGFRSGGNWFFLRVEGVLFLQIAWWLATMLSYNCLLLITLERWLFIAYPFWHHRLFQPKGISGMVAICLGFSIIGCALFNTEEARRTNVGFFFPVLHTALSIIIFSTYAHIILISYRQQRSIRALSKRLSSRLEPVSPVALSNTDNGAVYATNGHLHNTPNTAIGSVDTSCRNDFDGDYNASHPTKSSGKVSFLLETKHSLQKVSRDNTASLTAVSCPGTVESSTGCGAVVLCVTEINDGFDHEDADNAVSAPHVEGNCLRGKQKTENETRKEGKKGRASKEKSGGVVSTNWRALRMSVTVFCMYFCFMSPWIYFQAVSSFIKGSGIDTGEISQALNTLTCLHFCSNFFVYAFQNRDFRTVLKQHCMTLLGCCSSAVKNRVVDISSSMNKTNH
ncbi:adenosine receptor a2 [Plakobranchus ocellatus]|uniref:Adenosine receptor a2 n=1 Tax=Plakobranchus ocellatus TaxID=259542 RepID=A0AAV3ZRM6_9GAST|nr:adenosine receptor a2 [Plakobranchus ocellatus]